MHFLRDHFPEALFPTSFTTRKPRAGEKWGVSGSGKNYTFTTEEDFKRRIPENFFLEWAEYSGSLYGTPRQEVEDALKSGRLVIQELEIQGVRTLKKEYEYPRMYTIFIDAGDWNELKDRIQGREEMSEEELQKRGERYQEEMAFQKEADFTVHNKHGDVESAKKELSAIINSVLE